MLQSVFLCAVFLVTAGNTPGNFRAVTVASFSSISLDPDIVSFAIKNPSRMNALLSSSEFFSMHLLSRHQSQIARLFSTPQDPHPFCQLNYTITDREGTEFVHHSHSPERVCPHLAGAPPDSCPHSASVSSHRSHFATLHVHGSLFGLHCKHHASHSIGKRSRPTNVLVHCIRGPLKLLALIACCPLTMLTCCISFLGTHTVWFGEVVKTVTASSPTLAEEPLTYFQREYSTVLVPVSPENVLVPVSPENGNKRNP